MFKIRLEETFHNVIISFRIFLSVMSTKCNEKRLFSKFIFKILFDLKNLYDFCSTEGLNDNFVFF